MIKSSIPLHFNKIFVLAILIWTFYLGYSLSPQMAQASACCGGVATLPNMIIGDDTFQFSSNFSYSKIDTYVSEQGIWNKKPLNDHSQILKLDFAAIYYDRYQYGFSIPLHQRQVEGPQGGTAQGLGDISFQLGYEYLSNWDYPPYSPKSIGYLTLTVPTGKSIYEEDNLHGLNSRGRGFWSLGIGSAFTKTFQKYDGIMNIELHRAASKKVANSQFNGTIEPGWGFSYSIGAGYNWDKARIGHTISWTYEDPIKSTGNVDSYSSSQKVTTGSIILSYLLPPHLTTSISYSDQTWYGDPSNTDLNKTLLVTVVKRWSK